jgi:hypothetical protein
MKRLILFVFALLVAYPALGTSLKKGPRDTVADVFELCRAGVRGGGYDASTQLYDWTCGNYPWSASVGGVTTADDGSTISAYGSPTTAGGNSWTMVCTGDGVADQTGNGSTTADATPVEETVCLYSGERIRMYVMADLMLAADNTKNGGKIYIPDGLYHLAYCGQQADGTTNNGCPVLQHFPNIYNRHVSTWGQREFVGESRDSDGPLVNGRTGVYLLNAGGDDLDGNGTMDADEICDRNDDGWCSPSNMVIATGGGHGGFQCLRDDATGGCAVQSSTTGRLTMNQYGGAGDSVILDVDIEQGNNVHSRACLDNSLTNTGTCSLDRSVSCTTNTVGRLSASTGSCEFDDDGDGTAEVDLGVCEGIVTAMQTDMVALEAVDAQHTKLDVLIQTKPRRHRYVSDDPPDTYTTTTLTQVGFFDVDGTDGHITGATTTLDEDLDNSETGIDLTDAGSFATAGTILVGEERITYTGKAGNTLTGGGRGADGTLATTHANGAAVSERTLEACAGADTARVYFSAGPEGGRAAVRFFPSPTPVWDAGTQPHTSLYVVDWSKYNMHEGGYRNIGIMPAHWLGRDSTNDAADCSAFGSDPGLMDSGAANAHCDSLGMLGLWGNYRGHMRYISTWFGSNTGFAKSLVDGGSTGIRNELGWSELNDAEGLASDPSEWWFHDNTWRNWYSASGSFMVFNFAYGQIVENERYINISSPIGFRPNGSGGMTLRDLYIQSSNFSNGMFDIREGKGVSISGVRGYGNRDPIVMLAPTAGSDVWDVTIEDVHMDAHSLLMTGTLPEGLIVRYDNDGNATFLGGTLDNVSIKDVHISIDGTQNACMVFLEGGLGDEVTVTNNDDEENGDGRTVDDDRHQISLEDISLSRVTSDTVSADVEFFCLGNAVAAEQAPSEAISSDIFDAKGGIPRWTGLSIDGHYYPDNPYRSVRAVDTTLNSTDSVDDVNEEIDWTDHGLRNYDAVTLNVVANNPPTGLSDATTYYVRYLTKDSIRLYANRNIEDDDYCTAVNIPYQCCTGSGTGTCSYDEIGLTDAVGTFTLTTGFEPDCGVLPQGTVVRTHSATAEGTCTDGDVDGLLDGGGDFNAACVCDGAGGWSAL